MMLMARSVLGSAARLTSAAERLVGLAVLAREGVTLAGSPDLHGIPYVRNRGSMALGVGVTLASGVRSNPVGADSKLCLVTREHGSITIGDGARISNSLLHARLGIDIGPGVFIGGGCMLVDNDFHSLVYERRILTPDPDIQAAPITVRRGAFIGARSIVLKGVVIGVTAIVGAGSVVTRDVPEGEIWAGNPARHIGDVPR